MNKIQLASLDLCTGCGACAHVCPKSCIVMKEDISGAKYPVIDRCSCIECGRCMKSCPVLSPLSVSPYRKSFASWSAIQDDRHHAASGGIASALYRYAIKKGWFIVGASMNDDFSVSLNVTDDIESLSSFRNSKYVFSEPYSSFKCVSELLKQGHTIVVVGLPCQIAAYRKLFTKYDKIYYVDLICHGIMPSSYLQQHVHAIEDVKKQKAKRLYFRDPAFYTYTYTFTLYNQDNQCMYAKKVREDDLYQEAYHDGIAYRENCYHCPYASENRVSDITLGDYYGLGKEVPFEFALEKVSCVLTNSDKGDFLISQLIDEGYIEAYERPRNEPLLGNKMLSYPCIKTRKRKYFEYYIQKYKGDFNAAISAVVKRYAKWKLLNESVLFIKRTLKRFLR